ncbi:MAG: hypothetical protein IPH46_17825 [Bacteroidetes bacterium]|nr:hypothetical protein [Bacteroidota bacterium]
MKADRMVDTRLIKGDLYRLIASCFDYPDKSVCLTSSKWRPTHKAGYPDENINIMLQSLVEAAKDDEAL